MNGDTNKLNEIFGEDPIFFIKFCSQEKYAKDVSEGKLYANTVGYYRDLEKQEGNQSKGDVNELTLNIPSDSLSIFSESGKFICELNSLNASFNYNDDFKRPLFSIMGITIKDLVCKNEKEKYRNCSLNFTDDDYLKLEKELGEWCVIIEASEFLGRIKTSCELNKTEYIFDKVEYCEKNSYEKKVSFQNRTLDRFLFKNISYSYQKEYRLIVACKMPTDHYLSVGKFNSALIRRTNDLKNILFRIECK